MKTPLADLNEELTGLENIALTFKDHQPKGTAETIQYLLERINKLLMGGAFRDIKNLSDRRYVMGRIQWLEQYLSEILKAC